MTIGLYGLPTAGKTYIMDRIDFMDVYSGSRFLREIAPGFDTGDEEYRNNARKKLARELLQKDDFIMDGHYQFGKKKVFTEADGMLYDAVIYLYIKPDILRERMALSEKNRKYLVHDIERWQRDEIAGLRAYCHENLKDFYVIDNPPVFDSEDTRRIIRFIKDIMKGYSCVSFARDCAKSILAAAGSNRIILTDGDKTLIREDSSNVFLGYRTHTFDGNFYTGYQAWKQKAEMQSLSKPHLDASAVTMNEKVISRFDAPAFILSSGDTTIWGHLADSFGYTVYAGDRMTAETKAFIARLLQQAGKYVIVYGDSMSDYFMLRQADEGYLVTRDDGSISRSLNGTELEDIRYV